MHADPACASQAGLVVVVVVVVAVVGCCRLSVGVVVALLSLSLSRFWPSPESLHTPARPQLALSANIRTHTETVSRDSANDNNS
jgi:hypothetical protein